MKMAGMMTTLWESQVKIYYALGYAKETQIMLQMENQPIRPLWQYPAEEGLLISEVRALGFTRKHLRSTQADQCGRVLLVMTDIFFSMVTTLCMYCIFRLSIINISGDWSIWVIKSDISNDQATILNKNRGLIHIPRTGWQYADGNNGWPDDFTLKVTGDN